MKKIPIGISSCLLGQAVRYDGGHKRDAYINGTLSEYFDFHACKGRKKPPSSIRHLISDI